MCVRVDLVKRSVEGDVPPLGGEPVVLRICNEDETLCCVHVLCVLTFHQKHAVVSLYSYNIVMNI